MLLGEGISLARYLEAYEPFNIEEEKEWMERAYLKGKIVGFEEGQLNLVKQIVQNSKDNGFELEKILELLYSCDLKIEKDELQKIIVNLSL